MTEVEVVGLLRVPDPVLLRRMEELQAEDPVQSRGRFLRRTLRFMMVRALLNPLPFTVFQRFCEMLGRSHDDVVNHSIRGFTGPDFVHNIRHRPSAAMLSLLARRLERFDGSVLARRTATAERTVARLPAVPRPGSGAARHTYWTFPVRADAPEALCRHLWNRGFDATRGKWSLFTVPSPGEPPEGASEAEAWMAGVVYLPVVHPSVRERDLERLGRALYG